MKRQVAIAAVPLLVGLLLAGCGPHQQPPDPPDPPEPPEPTARLSWITCPDAIEVQFISRHECGQLSVPQSSSDSAGPAVKLLVLKVWPVGKDPDGFLTSLGSNYGSPMPLGGDIAAGATRSGTVAALPALRGSGTHAVPSLACPETAQIRTAGVADDHPATRAAFTAAVDACARRLRTAGVEPADYDAASTAAGAEQLRTALEVEQWVSLATYGTSSPTLITYLDTYPGKAEVAFFDSPASPDLDPLTAGVVGLDSALAAFDRDHPGVLRDWSAALKVTRDRPLHGSSDGVQVTIDDAKLLRLIRFSLGGDGPDNASQVPAMLAAARTGKLHPRLAKLAADDPAYCAGYTPMCVTDFSLGLFLTDFCQQLPEDTGKLNAAVAGRPAYREVFAESPYLEACRVWAVPRKPLPELMNPELPILVLTGEYDSFSRPEWAEAWVRRLGDRAWSVTIPGQTHNVLGSSACAVAIRDAWRLHPSSPPDTSCARPAR